MNKKRILARILTICLLLGLMIIPSKTTYASNEDILNVRNGILQVMVSGTRSDGQIIDLYGGTGFLVGTDEGAQTVITNHHVIHPLDYYPEDEAEVRERLGLAADDDLGLFLRIVVKRDVYINASIVNESTEADFGILKLEQPIYDRAPLKLADSNDVETTSNVYALGFPRIVQLNQDDEIYTSEDVTVTNGIVSKTSDVQLVNAPIPCITHSVTITSGNSGGPLVNEKGEVIGVNRHSLGDDADSKYFYSVKINEITEVLNALGIEYESVDLSKPTNTPEPTDTPEPIDTPEPTISPMFENLKVAIDSARNISLDGVDEDVANKFQNAIDDATRIYNNTNATDEELQTAINDLKAAEKGLNENKNSSADFAMYIIIGAIILVVIIIAVVIMILTSSGNKKKKQQEERERQRRTVPGGYAGSEFGQGAQGGFGSGPQIGQNSFRQQRPPMNPMKNGFGANDGSAETGVLNDGASETTVLGGQNIPGAHLIRKKNGEKINITKAVFKIGKERRKVDYCVADNTNVSRTHADIVYKNGSFYIADNHATNGTSVNGASLASGQEKSITNNDVIRLADEEFQFKLF